MIIGIICKFHPEGLKLIKTVLPGFYQTTIRGSSESYLIFVKWSDDHMYRMQVSPRGVETDQKGSTRVLSRVSPGFYSGFHKGSIEGWFGYQRGIKGCLILANPQSLLTLWSKLRSFSIFNHLPMRGWRLTVIIILV